MFFNIVYPLGREEVKLFIIPQKQTQSNKVCDFQFLICSAFPKYSYLGIFKKKKKKKKKKKRNACKEYGWDKHILIIMQFCLNLIKLAKKLKRSSCLKSLKIPKPLSKTPSFQYENKPIQIYWKFYQQKMKIFR